MKNIKYSIFDLFSYTIPGLILIASCIVSFDILSIESENLKTIMEKDNKTLLVALIILLSYVSGFITNILGGFFLKLIILLVGKTEPKKSQLPNSTKILLLREFSPSNFNYIEKWSSMKNMCSNLAVVILGCSLLFLANNTLDVLLNLCLSLPIITLLLLKSFEFGRWYIIELDNAVDILKLEDNCVELLKSKNK